MYASGGGILSKDGFTLIELLSVIILIIGIMLIVLPKITGSVKNKEFAINTSYENIIFRALDLYISDNSSKYPKATTNTYCVAVDTLKKKGYLKDYDNDNIKTKNIVKVTYSGGYHYEMVDECTEQIIEYNKCTEEGKCSACMVLSEYNTSKEVYKYTPKIVKDVKISDGNLVNGTDITIVRNNDECVKEAIISAAKDHVVNNPKTYKKNRNNTYCISVESLINEGRLENNLVYLNKSITNYSVEVKYTSKYNYDLLESNSCKEKILYEDETLNGNDPYLNGDLTPVIYDSTNKVWRIADPYTKWYDYDNQWWANAVLLRSGVTKKVGDVVNIENKDPYEIVSIFVWIPRYEYKIDGSYGRGGKKYYPGEIDVNFISVDKENTDGFITPPGFKFGDENLNGFWISKFYAGPVTVDSKDEYYKKISVFANTSYSDQASDYQYCVKNSIDKNYACAFFAIKNMTLDSKYGLDDSVYDSHMMKNAEYAAVTYLSQSKYGKYGNDMFPKEYKTITPTAQRTGRLYLDNANIPYNDDHFTKTVYKQNEDSVKTTTFNNTTKTDQGTNNWSYTIDISEKATLSFSYQIKGLLKDYISYSLKNTSTNEIISSNELSASKSKDVSLIVEPGKYTLDFTYLKNRSGSIYSASSTNVTIKEGGWGNVVEDDYYNGVASSTTGTVYGVYDLVNLTGTLVSALLGDSYYTKTFGDTVVDPKYYDVYTVVKGDSSCTAPTSSDYCIKSENAGHALPSETNLWSDLFGITNVSLASHYYLERGGQTGLYTNMNIFTFYVNSDTWVNPFIILTYK